LNFNKLVLFLIFFVVTGCGVKSDPVPPTGSAIPTFINEVSSKYDRAVPKPSSKKEKDSKDEEEDSSR